MKHRLIVIGLLITALTAFSAVPHAKAEPLTIMAIIGVATVLSVSTIDIATSDHGEDNKDMRAKSEDTEKLHDKVATTERAPTSEKLEVAARQN